MTMNVNPFEKRAEAFREEMNREYYQALAGLKEQLEIAPIYERYADLFAEDTVQALLGQRQDKQGRPGAESQGSDRGCHQLYPESHGGMGWRRDTLPGRTTLYLQ
jgi:hypothetical protein